MRIPVERHPVRVNPDSKRVIARFFFNGQERAVNVIKSIMELSEDDVIGIISPLMQEFSKRHRNITKKLYRNCNKLRVIIESLVLEFEKFTHWRKFLFGSYFTLEYSIDSAAFFNPSLIEVPDQSGLE